MSIPKKPIFFVQRSQNSYPFLSKNCFPPGPVHEGETAAFWKPRPFTAAWPRRIVMKKTAPHRIGEDSTQAGVDSRNRVLGERHSNILTCLFP